MEVEMKYAFLSLFVISVGCGAAKYPRCAIMHQQSCIDIDGDDVAESAALCDGEYWMPAMDCSEQWNSNGDHIDLDCEIQDGYAVCVTPGWEYE
jgi:hypothetical protein